MQITVTTWNINSVRLRIDLVAKFIKAVRPDVLCLQETKCPDDSFPLQALQAARLRAHRAQRPEGLSRRRRSLAAAVRVKHDARLIAARPTAGISRSCSASSAGLKDPITLHNFYVPAGGDIPDPALNPKFAHKLAFLDEMHDMRSAAAGGERARHPRRRSQRRAARTRRLEPQAAARRRLAHAGRMREASRPCRRPAAGSMPCARFVPEPRSSTPGGAIARRTGSPDRGRRLDHIWVSPALADRVVGDHDRQGMRAAGAAVRPCAGDGDAGSLIWSAAQAASVEAEDRCRARAPSRTIRHVARPRLGRLRDALRCVAQARAQRPDSLRASSGTGARDAQHGRRLARGRRHRPRRFGEQRHLAQQRARPGR